MSCCFSLVFGAHEPIKKQIESKVIIAFGFMPSGFCVMFTGNTKGNNKKVRALE
jgi:hypothetical protein